MPVLPLEPFVYPEELLAQPVWQADAQWWVLHTRPRAEKQLARQLVAKEVGFFLPLYERRVRMQRRLVRSFLPLFPGYLFLQGTEEDRGRALGTGLVVGCLVVSDQDRLTQDLVRIHELIQSDAPLSPERQLEPGMEAEITSGPLAGCRGTIVRRTGNRLLRFVVEVKFLQQGVSVEVDESMIERVETRRTEPQPVR